MAESNWIPRAWLPALMALTLQVTAADKVRFGSPEPSSTALVAQPTPTVEIDIPQSRSFQVSTPGAVNPALPGPTITTSGRPAAVDEEQRNWIFRDTQSVDGIRRALGIEVSTEAQISDTRAVTAETVMLDYFNRQTRAPQFTPDTGAALNKMGPSVDGANLSPNQGFGMGTDTTVSRPSPGIGNNAFSTTLNSSSPVIRNHYRQVYNQQLSPINQPMPELAGSPLSSAQDNSRFQNLYQQSQAIKSQTDGAKRNAFDIEDPLTPRTPERVPETPFQASDLVERRGGKIVIPSRPF